MFPAYWLQWIHPDQVLSQKYFWDVFTTIQTLGCLEKAPVAPKAFEASCQQLLFQFFCLILHTNEVVFLKEDASVNLFVLSYVFALLAISFASCAPRLPLNIFSASCRSYSDTTHTHKVNLRTSQFAKLVLAKKDTLAHPHQWNWYMETRCENKQINIAQTLKDVSTSCS